jgi:hypothetical protein
MAKIQQVRRKQYPPGHLVYLPTKTLNEAGLKAGDEITIETKAKGTITLKKT